jgi:bacterioferritin-associated ferredoxin
MITCVCLGISENTIVDAIENGCDDIFKLQEKTGLGMCCGMCMFRIDNLFSKSDRKTTHPAYAKIKEAIERKK